MAAREIRIGDTRVDLLLDGAFEEARDHLMHGRGPAALAASLAGRDDGFLRLDLNAFLLRGPRGVELVDAGAGPTRGPDLGHVRAALAAHGVEPADVDRVFLTHMHFDHVLGLLDGDAPRLPRAEVIVPAADLAHYTDAAERARVPEAFRFVWDDAARIARAYEGRLRASAFGPLAPGVDLIPIPGHSPGQGAYAFTAGGETLLLFGDLLHFAGPQAADPDLGLVYDHDPVAAARSRREVLGRAAAGGWTLGGGHMHGFGRAAREGAGFRITPL